MVIWMGSSIGGVGCWDGVVWGAFPWLEPMAIRAGASTHKAKNIKRKINKNALFIFDDLIRSLS